METLPGIVFFVRNVNSEYTSTNYRPVSVTVGDHGRNKLANFVLERMLCKTSGNAGKELEDIGNCNICFSSKRRTSVFM